MQTISSSTAINSPFLNFIHRLKNIIQIVAIESFATIKFTIPANFRWLFRRHITKEIHSFSQLEMTTESKVKLIAHVYLHHPINISHKICTPLLLLPGDFATPSTLLHLADIAKDNSSNPIFSVHLPKSYDNNYFFDHKNLLAEVISKIENFITNQGGIFQGIVGVGHSKGAILLTHLFDNPKINQVCSIAGRLRSFVNDSSCNQKLKEIIATIADTVALYPDKILHQIIPEKDWNAPYEAMVLREDPHFCHKVPGMHLSGLYEPATRSAFKAIVCHAK